MAQSDYLLALALPRSISRRESDGKLQLHCSVVFSPVIRKELGPGGSDEWAGDNTVFYNWPEFSGFPWPKSDSMPIPKVEFIVRVGQNDTEYTLTVERDLSAGVAEIEVNGNPIGDQWDEEPFAALPSELWSYVFGEDTWTISEERKNYEDKDRDYEKAKKPREVIEKARDGNTVEGISTEELSDIVACGVLSDSVKSEIPEEIKSTWRTVLRTIDFATSRLDKLGTAGAQSQVSRDEIGQAAKRKNPGAPTDLGRVLGKEFHRRLAAVDDYPAIQRLLGLIIDVKMTIDDPDIEAALRSPNEAKVDLVIAPKVEFSGDDSPEMSLPKGTACRIHFAGTGSDPSGNNLNALFVTRNSRGNGGDGQSEETYEVINGCVNTNLLGTVQWDVNGGSRAVLRSNGFGVSKNVDWKEEGESKFPDTTLNGYGVSVFWREHFKSKELRDVRKGFLESAAQRYAEDSHNLKNSFNEKPGAAADGIELFFADDLVLGYVPSVKPGNGATWQSLTARQLKWRADIGGVVREITWKDEKCLAQADSEALQPLVGWVLDFLGEGDKGVLYFAVATPSGVIVVAEPKKNDEVDLTKLGVEQGSWRITGSQMRDWIPGKAGKGGAVLEKLGSLVEFEGRWVEGTGCFLSTSSVPRFGEGLAGVIVGAPKLTASRRVVRIAVSRRMLSFDASGQLISSDGPITFVYLRLSGNFEKSLPPIFPTVDGNDQTAKVPLFQGVGNQGLVIPVAKEKDKAFLKIRVPSTFVTLEYKGKIEKVLKFALHLENGSETSSKKAKEVELEWKDSPRVVLLDGTVRESDDQLLMNGLYRVKAIQEEDQDGGEITIKLVEMREVSEGRQFAFESLSRQDDGRFLVTFSRGEDRPPFVVLIDGDETELVFSPLLSEVESERANLMKVAAHVSAASAPGPIAASDAAHSAVGPAADQLNPLVIEPFSAGSFRDLALHLVPGDICHIYSAEIEQDGKTDSLVDRVEVVRREANVIFGKCEGLAKNRFDETLYTVDQVDRIIGTGPTPENIGKLNVRIDDSTVVVSRSWTADETGKWRVWNSPPEGEFVLVHGGDTIDGVLSAKRVEIVNVLSPERIESLDISKSDIEFVLSGYRFKGKKALPMKLSKPLTAALEKLRNSSNLGQGDLESLLKESALNAVLFCGGGKEIAGIEFTLSGKGENSDTNVVQWMPDHSKDLKMQINLKNDQDYLLGADELTIRILPEVEKEKAGYSCRLSRTVTSSVTSLMVQLSDVEAKFSPDTGAFDDEGLVRADGLVLTAPENHPEIELNKVLPVYIEDLDVDPALAVADETGNRERIYRFMKVAAETGFPVQLTAESALVCDGADTEDSEWEVLSLELPTTSVKTGKKIEHVDYLVGGGAPVFFAASINAKIYRIWEYSYFETEDLKGAKNENFSLVHRVAAGSPDKNFKVSKEPYMGGEYTVEEGIKYTGEAIHDQVIAEDTLMHWNGWSLAVPTLGYCGKEGEQGKVAAPAADGDENTDLDVSVSLIKPEKTHSGYSLPRLRFGRDYVFQIRTMDLCGHVLEIDRLVNAPGLPNELKLRPFHEMGLKEGGNGIFCRFDPVAAPVVWESEKECGDKKARPDLDLKYLKQPSVMPADIVLMTDRDRLIRFRSGRFQEEASDKDEKLLVPAVIDKSKVGVLPPPVHWHLAELAGAFDPVSNGVGKVSLKDLYGYIKGGAYWKHAREALRRDEEQIVNRRVKAIQTLREPNQAQAVQRKTKRLTESELIQRATKEVASLENALKKVDAAIREIEKEIAKLTDEIGLHRESKQWDKVDEKQKRREKLELSLRQSRAVQNTSFHKRQKLKSALKTIQASDSRRDDLTRAWKDSVFDPYVHRIWIEAGAENRSHWIDLPHFNFSKEVPNDVKPSSLTFEKAENTDSTNALKFAEDEDVNVYLYGLSGNDHQQAPENHFLHRLIEAFSKSPDLSLESNLKGLFQELFSWFEVGDDQILPEALFEELAEKIAALGVHEKKDKGDKHSPPHPLQLHRLASTPYAVRVRHVTNKPLFPPEFVSMRMNTRVLASTVANFVVRYGIHRPSTRSVFVQAAMEPEYVDDPKNPLPRVPRKEMLRILEDPELKAEYEQPDPDETGPVSLGKSSDGITDIFVGVYDVTELPVKTPEEIGSEGEVQENFSFTHDLQDNRHRTVFYRGVARTRFGEEIFGPDWVETNPRTIHRQEETEGWIRVEHPSTTRPNAPEVEDVTNLLEWLPRRDSNPWRRAGLKSWVFTRSRQCGHRIWMRRPWYSSGSEEKLAFLTWMTTDVGDFRTGKDSSDPNNEDPQKQFIDEKDQFQHLVCRWGSDPVFETAVGEDMGLLTRDDFVGTWSTVLGLESLPMAKDSQDDGVSDSPAKEETVLDVGGEETLPVGLAVYQPKFHPEEKLWYCDVFVDAQRYTPFISYSIARYQPSSIPTCALSEPKRLDMLQVLPARSCHISIEVRSGLEFSVTLAGIFPPQNKRKVTAVVEYNPLLEEMGKVEESEEEIIRKLGWKPVRLIDGSGKLSESVQLRDNEISCDGVEFDFRLPNIPFFRSVWDQKVAKYDFEDKGKKKDEESPYKPCKYLRLTIAESEIFPCAHPELEGNRESDRTVFIEQVMVPSKPIEQLTQLRRDSVEPELEEADKAGE